MFEDNASACLKREGGSEGREQTDSKSSEGDRVLHRPKIIGLGYFHYNPIKSTFL